MTLPAPVPVPGVPLFSTVMPTGLFSALFCSEAPVAVTVVPTEEMRPPPVLPMVPVKVVGVTPVPPPPVPPPPVPPVPSTPVLATVPEAAPVLPPELPEPLPVLAEVPAEGELAELPQAASKSGKMHAIAIVRGDLMLTLAICWILDWR